MLSTAHLLVCQNYLSSSIFNEQKHSGVTVGHTFSLHGSRYAGSRALYPSNVVPHSPKYLLSSMACVDIKTSLMSGLTLQFERRIGGEREPTGSANTPYKERVNVHERPRSARDPHWAFRTQRFKLHRTNNVANGESANRIGYTK